MQRPRPHGHGGRMGVGGTPWSWGQAGGGGTDTAGLRFHGHFRCVPMRSPSTPSHLPTPAVTEWLRSNGSSAQNVAARQSQTETCACSPALAGTDSTGPERPRVRSGMAISELSMEVKC